VSGVSDLVVRKISCELEDGAKLTIVAERPRGAGHGEESVSAELVRDEGPVEIAEARLTTEYGPDGQARRFGIELLLPGEEEPPLRGAGVLREDGGFDFSLEGVAGVASYSEGSDP
jgi:hypothetical protein